LMMAADAALQLNATTEAIAYYERAMPIALAADDTSPELIRLYLSRGRAIELQSRFQDADASYHELEQLALDHGDRSMELQAIIAQGKLRSNVTPFFDPVAGRALMGRALELARELGDRAAEVRILWNLVNIDRFDLNSMKDAVERGEKALAMARELGLEEEEAYLLNDLSDIYATIGLKEDAERVLVQAQERWRALKNEPMLADSLSNACMLAFAAGDFGQALDLATEAYGISLRIANAWGQAFSLGLRGIVYIYQGEFGRALEDLPLAITRATEANFVGGQGLSNTFLAQVYQEVGHYDDAAAYAAEGLRISREFLPQFAGLSLGRLALVRLAQGTPDEAAIILSDPLANVEKMNYIVVNDILISRIELALAFHENDKALDLAVEAAQYFAESGYDTFLPDIYHAHARALLALERTAEAQDFLQQAISIARRIELRGQLWRYLVTAVKMADGDGRHEMAGDLLREAQAEIAFLAGNIQPDEFRETFLAQSAVRQVLEAPGITRREPDETPAG
jgi:tetratricopeptide (TPR) repeat protein